MKPAESRAATAVFTDSHAHLSMVEERLGAEAVNAVLRAYEETRADALEKGRSASAPFIVDIGVDPGDLGPRMARFGNEASVLFAAGLWPGAGPLGNPGEALERLRADLRSPRCAALGECGLDYFHMEGGREEQIRLFEAQAKLAAEFGLPLLVHSREAFEDTLKVVSKVAGAIPVVIHCFGYDEPQALEFLGRDCILSFAGNLTYKKSEGLRRALAAAPLDRILLETDSPYMNPAPNRGAPSTSVDIGRTLVFAAALKGVEADVLAEAAQANAFRIFSEKRDLGAAALS